MPLPGAKIEAVVCIPTFKRPGLLQKTLESLTQQIDAPKFAVVVVDNDALNREGKSVAERFFDTGLLHGFCQIEANQGNCFAINHAFKTARDHFKQANYFLMIDDDETASPHWLAQMLKAAQQSNADIIGGPVHRQFEHAANSALYAHTIFNSDAVADGPVPSLHGSGNCLISRHVFDTLGEPSFDLRFNFLGGGDMDFFTRARHHGFSTCWSNAAFVDETVPVARMLTKWVLKRSLYIGVINYTIDRKCHPGLIGGLRMLGKNILCLPLSLVRAARIFFKTGHWLPASFPICLALGRNLAVFGFAPAPYKG